MSDRRKPLSRSFSSVQALSLATRSSVQTVMNRVKRVATDTKKCARYSDQPRNPGWVSTLVRRPEGSTYSMKSLPKRSAFSGMGHASNKRVFTAETPTSRARDGYVYISSKKKPYKIYPYTTGDDEAYPRSTARRTTSRSSNSFIASDAGKQAPNIIGELGYQTISTQNYEASQAIDRDKILLELASGIVKVLKDKAKAENPTNRSGGPTRNNDVSHHARNSQGLRFIPPVINITHVNDTPCSQAMSTTPCLSSHIQLHGNHVDSASDVSLESVGQALHMSFSLSSLVTHVSDGEEISFFDLSAESNGYCVVSESLVPIAAVGVTGLLELGTSQGSPLFASSERETTVFFPDNFLDTSTSATSLSTAAENAQYFTALTTSFEEFSDVLFASCLDSRPPLSDFQTHLPVSISRRSSSSSLSTIKVKDNRTLGRIEDLHLPSMPRAHSSRNQHNIQYASPTPLVVDPVSYAKLRHLSPSVASFLANYNYVELPNLLSQSPGPSASPGMGHFASPSKVKSSNPAFGKGENVRLCALQSPLPECPIVRPGSPKDRNAVNDGTLVTPRDWLFKRCPWLAEDMVVEDQMNQLEQGDVILNELPDAGFHPSPLYPEDQDMDCSSRDLSGLRLCSECML